MGREVTAPSDPSLEEGSEEEAQAGSTPALPFSQSRESSPIGAEPMEQPYRVVMGFEPTGPQFSSPFNSMEEAFEAYNRCIELPGKVSVFVFKNDGKQWKPLLGRSSAAWKKALKAGNTPAEA